jgi:hypothetical protein
MSIAVSSSRTMSNVQPIPDPGIDLRKFHRRERVIRLAKSWKPANANVQEDVTVVCIPKPKRKFVRVSVNGFPHPLDAIEHVSNRHGVSVSKILSRDRRHHIVAARHAAIAEVYVSCRIQGRRMSLPEVGRVFGLDHTSVLHALRKLGVVEA